MVNAKMQVYRITMGELETIAPWSPLKATAIYGYLKTRA